MALVESESLSDAHPQGLDNLLKRGDNGKTTWLAWLRQSPAKTSSRHMFEHIEHLKAWQALNLPPASSGAYTKLACSRWPTRVLR